MFSFKSALCFLLIFALGAPLLGCSGNSTANTANSGTSGTSGSAPATTPAEPTLAEKIEAQSQNLTDASSVKALRDLVWQEYAANVESKQPGRKDEVRRNKITKIKIGGVTMKVQTKVIGTAPENGYPVFLVYHGGGYDPSGQTNESQWSGMATRYTATKVAGIYVSIRSVSDNESSGQIFSTNISWKFYDRILEDCILYLNADPNKAYIVGYSAGGNGVYQIAPVLADRLAAANMTAGHPEGIDLTSLYNLPFYLQVGELDPAYNRNTVTVEYCVKLDELAKKYGGGYTHKCFVHVNKEHGVVGDNATSKQTVVKDLAAWYDAYKQSGTLATATGNTTSEITDAATLMTAHTRDPLPKRVIWNLATSKPKQRGINSFYWLSTSATMGILDVSYDRDTNTVSFKGTPRIRSGEITVYLNEDMVNLFSDVKVISRTGKETVFTPEISLDVLRETTAERGDSNYQFCAKITLTADQINA